MNIRIDDIYRVQAAIWGKFNSCIFSDGLGWAAWESFMAQNGLEREGGVLDFQLHEGGRVSVLDPSNYGRLWMSEDFARKVLFLGGAP